MQHITKEAIRMLAGIEASPCVSIYLATHQTGQEVLQNADAIALGNRLKSVEGKLSATGLSQSEVDKFTSPIRQLILDKDFWRYQSAGLALFLSDGLFRKYTLPVAVPERSDVSNVFYLAPLLPLVSQQQSFYILALDLEDMRFYRATRFQLEEITHAVKIPERKEEVVGYDYEQKSLQFRSQMAGEATFHGHGEGKDDRKEEITRYFRSVNDALMKVLHNEKAPLVTVGLDYLAGIYREVNTYQYLLPQHVPGNPSDLEQTELLEVARDAVRPVLDRETEDKAGLFRQVHGTGNTSTNVLQIVPAAEGGRVDTLFLSKGTDIVGSYDHATKNAEIHDQNDGTGISLTNLAAVQTFLNGGQVYVFDEESMPDPSSSINALYRY